MPLELGALDNIGLELLPLSQTLATSAMDRKPTEVAVFWDLGSCPASGGDDSAFNIVDKIRSLASRFGVIKFFKGYIPDDTSRSIPPLPSGAARMHRSQLQSSGVSLTDVPGRREYSDKMIVVDMLAYAFDRPTNATVLVLITAEPSFAYALALLRMRNYGVVLLAPEGDATFSLRSQVSSCFNWAYQVDPVGCELGLQPHATSEHSLRPPQPARSTLHIAGNYNLPPTGEAPFSTSTPAPAGERRIDCEEDQSRKQRSGSTNEAPSTFTAKPEAHLSPVQPSGNGILGAPGQRDGFGNEVDGRYRSNADNDADDEDPAASSPTILAFGEFPPSSPFVDQKATPSEGTTNSYPSQPSSCASQTTNTVKKSPQWYGLSTGQDPTLRRPDMGDQQRSAAHSAVGSVNHEFLTPSEALASFSTLVDVLAFFKSQGFPRPLRSTVAVEMTRRDRFVYKNAGCSTFAQFTSKAEALGLVELGGWMGTAWIGLKN